MSGPKRNPDKINTIGVVVVGICGAVLVYVSIVALQAFYMNDTSESQQTADYGGQETAVKTLKADQIRAITETATNPAQPGGTQTFRIPIDQAIKLTVEEVKKDSTHLIPALPPSTHPTIQPVFGRPKLAPPPAATPAPAGATPAPAGAAAGSGSAAAVDLKTAPMAATGGGTGPQPVAGAGALPSAGSAAPRGHAPGN